MSDDPSSIEQSPEATRFGSTILWERPIQTLSALFVRAGDHVLDVGANIGALSTAFSRLVGKRGRVLSFECNPRLAAWAKANLAASDAGNVVLESRACYREAGLKLEFVCETTEMGAASSLRYRHIAGQRIEVETTTIDQACAQHAVAPRLIKIDVEGAEVDVLEGGRKTIAAQDPVLIFERASASPTDDDPLEWVLDAGYRCYDVNTLKPVPRGWAESIFHKNIVAVREADDPHFEFEAAVTAPALKDEETAILPRLKSGLWVIDVEIEASSDAHGDLKAFDEHGDCVLHYGAGARHLADPSCSSFPIQLGRPQALNIRLRAPDARLVRVTARSVRHRLSRPSIWRWRR